MKRLMILAALMFATAAQANTSEECSSIAEIAGYALEVRNAGVSEDVVLAYLAENGTYSGLPVWAVKVAYDAPPSIRPWILKGSVMAECRKRSE